MRVPPALLGLIVASVAASAQTANQTAAPPSPSATAPSPDASAAAPSVYHNDALKLDYSYPSYFKDATDMVGPAFQASMAQNPNAAGNDDLRCVSLPFSAMNSTGGNVSMVLLIRADAICMKKSFTAAQLSQFTKGEVTGLTASGAHTHFGEPVSFTTAGHAAQLIRGTFDLPTGQSMHSLVACVLVQPDVACWQFLGSSDDTLRSMGAFPVTFDGSKPTPLIPAEVLAKP